MQSNSTPSIDGPREDPRVTSMLDLMAPVEGFLKPDGDVYKDLILILRLFQGMVRRFQAWRTELNLLSARLAELERGTAPED